MSLSIDDFADEQAQIHWALSYFKSGCTATFVDRTLHKESKRGGWSYATWADFKAGFWLTFCLKNEATTSLMHLESEHYFQGRQTMDMYVNEFSDLIDLSGYSDPLAIVINFTKASMPPHRTGLQNQVQTGLRTTTPLFRPELIGQQGIPHFVDTEIDSRQPCPR
jgi:hypothetical protein